MRVVDALRREVPISTDEGKYSTFQGDILFVEHTENGSQAYLSVGLFRTLFPASLSPRNYISDLVFFD